MAITNLTNTTWVFKDGPLDFSDLKRGVRPLNFSCDYFGALHAFWYDYSSSNSTHYINYVYVMPQNAQVYTQNDSTGVFSWGKSDYQTIQITGGLLASAEDFINFLSKNAVCQTPLVTVTFDMNGVGASVGSQTFASGEKATIPTEPSVEGYTFVGWYTDPGLTTAFDFGTSVTSNITLYAKWITKVIKVKVGGAWKSGIPLVKVNNTWKDVEKLLVKVNGAWQTIINNVLPQPVKCAEFSVASNNSYNSGSFSIGYGYLSFKILTNEPFLFNIDVAFNSNESWYTVGTHSSNIPSKVSGYYVIDNPILDSTEVSYTGTISIPGGNINKYIVIYFDKEASGSISGTFEFLSNYYSGGIYV